MTRPRKADEQAAELTPTPRGRCVNVGCGRDLRAGWVNVDVEAIPGALRASITHLPFRDGALDYVLASHVLEHVPDVKRAIAELARILRTEATLEIRAPDYRHENAYTDLEHLHFFTPRSMDYFAEGSETYRHRYAPLFSRVRVKEVREHPGYPGQRLVRRVAPSVDRFLVRDGGAPAELRFYCVKR